MKAKENFEINYFGTNLKEAGHYFFTISEYGMSYASRIGHTLPFDPEGLIENVPDGTVNRYNLNNDYKIIVIAGSPIDKRGGCKSVFWTQEKITLADFEYIIQTHPFVKKMIEQMPFEIKW